MRLSLAAAAIAVAFASPAAFADTIEVHGSTTVSGNLLMPKKAEIEKATGFELQIVGNGSGRGLLDIIEGKVKVAMISAPPAGHIKSLKAKGVSVDEASLTAHRVGSAPAALAVHPGNPVKSLSADQVAGILSGKIKN